MITQFQEQYDANWVEKHALSKISEDSFEKIIDDLEKSGKITK